MWPLVSGSSGWTQWPGVVTTWWLPNALCTDVLLPTQHLATMGNQFPLASLLTHTAGQASEGLEQSSTGGWSQEPAATSQHAWQPSSPHPNASTAGLCCIWGYGTAPAVLQSLGATKCPGRGLSHRHPLPTAAPAQTLYWAAPAALNRTVCPPPGAVSQAHLWPIRGGKGQGCQLYFCVSTSPISRFLLELHSP